MANSSSGKGKTRAGPNNPDLIELRQIILGPETTRLHSLVEKLENPELQAEELSRVLPRAIRLRKGQDKELAWALGPTVEQVIEESIRKNPQTLIRVLFPIMGAMVRKAVATALRGMLESFNRTLDQSLSPQSLRWRIEAWRTGKPFAEVVLLHSLNYRVEQVFLIHRETGLLLAHVVAEAVQTQDPSLVSAMLTAITDFMEDSFRISKEEGLEVLQFGGLSVLVKLGPSSVLAAVVRGTAPASLGNDLDRILEQIHLEFGAYLQELPDDTDLFHAAEPLLAECLKTGFKRELKQKKGLSPLLWAAGALFILLVGSWVFLSVRDRLRWNDFLTRLEEQKGIVVTEAERGFRRYRVVGLRDPLSVEPRDVARQAGLDPDRMEGTWEPYLTLEPGIVEMRARQILDPPDSVQLHVKEGGVLSLTGSADREWISEASSRAGVIPGIRRVETTDLTDSTLEQLIRNIEGVIILFGEGSDRIRENQRGALDLLAAQIRGLENWVETGKRRLRLEITGSTDPSGTEQANEVLAQRRAQALQETLESLGITFRRIEVVLRSRPSEQDIAEESHDSLRRVHLRVVVDNSREAGVREP